MKKLSVLAALALCVTVGGVYAAWNYAEQGVSTVYAVGTVGITGVEGKTSKGTLKATGNNLAIKVDDIAEDNVLHQTKLTYNTEGYFTVTFTADANATADIKKDGIPLVWYVGLANTSNESVKVEEAKFTYDKNGDGDYADTDKGDVDAAIYTSINSDPVLITDDNLVWPDEETKQTKGVTNPNGTVTFTYEIAIKDVMDKVELNQIILETEAMHNAYSKQINSYVLHFHVGEPPVVQPK